MSNALVQRHTLNNAPPTCGGCGDSQSVAPSMNRLKAPYFCVHCCNYLDAAGAVSDF